jgi:alpha-ribazole phosphatase
MDDLTTTITRVWLIRHGEPADEVRGRCYGSLDVSLSENGRAQMVRVAGHLAGEPIAAIYSSPLRRAIDSANAIAAGRAIPCEPVEGLREIDFGGFEGLTWEEIAARYPVLYRQWMDTPTEVTFPNGENFSAMRGRVLRAFDEIRKRSAGRTIAIVSHGGVNRAIIAQALQMPDRRVFSLGQDYAAMNLLVWTGDFPKLESLNLRPAS